MDELVFIKDKQVVMDSLTVAETFNKEHARVLRDVRELECSEGWSCTQKYTNSGTQSTDYKEVMLAKGDRVKEWTPAPEDMATQSQISQLSDAINLRVHKGEVMSQINVEANRVLIDTTGKLVLNAQSTLISNAVIKNAHIDTLSGEKLTSKSVIADKLNVTNLASITANLGTVTAGRMMSQNNNMDLNLNTGSLTMQNAIFTLGGGANINFIDNNNTLKYELKNRKAGLLVGRSINNTYPFVALGATNLNQPLLATDGAGFSGFIANTNARESEDS